MNRILTIFKSIGLHTGEIVFTIALLVLLGFIFIPGWGEVSHNGSGEVCREDMHVIAEALKAEFKKDDYDWSKVLDQKRSQKIFETLKERSKDQKLIDADTTALYIDISETELMVKCRQHEENDPIQISMPKKYHTNLPTENKNPKPVGSITVSGIRTYVKDTALDKENPEKMEFSSKDDLKKLFSDLTVRIKYLDGETKELSKDEYTISTEGFDMSKTGEKTISVTYKGESNINTDIKSFFTFEVMKASQAPEFKVNFGKDKKYILSAWAWSDYVRDTTPEKNSTGASIVYYEGDYLYYPDGFMINIKADNSDPTASAMDIDKPEKPAYYVKLDKGNISLTEEVEKPENGMLWMDNNNEVYVWQEKASKEANAGWLRVYCEMKKAE